MKKAIALLLVVALSVSAAFAGFSMDFRIVGASADYGVAYEYNGFRTGVEMMTISPILVPVVGIMALMQEGGASGFQTLLTTFGPYLGIPSAFGLYTEYDLLPSEQFDLGAGVGVSVLTPFGLVDLLGRMGGNEEMTMINPTLYLDFACNLNDTHAITARLLFPFLYTVQTSSRAAYSGFAMMKLVSNVGYRLSF